MLRVNVGFHTRTHMCMHTHVPHTHLNKEIWKLPVSNQVLIALGQFHKELLLAFLDLTGVAD